MAFNIRNERNKNQIIQNRPNSSLFNHNNENAWDSDGNSRYAPPTLNKQASKYQISISRQQSEQEKMNDNDFKPLHDDQNNNKQTLDSRLRSWELNSQIRSWELKTEPKI